jgi:hypothetical protein
VKNYLAGFCHDPILKSDNVGKVGDTGAKGQVTEQEGQGDSKPEGGDSGGGGDENNSDENGDAVMLEKPRCVDLGVKY